MPQSIVRREIGSLTAVVLLLAAMLAPGVARGGVFGIPCEAGTASPSGFEPCTACPAGTFAQFTGSIACEPVPEGTWAPQGSPGFNFCSCPDEALCTIDRCDGATGVCTTHDPAPACTPYSVRAEGTVTEVQLGLAPLFPPLPGVFSIGMPIVATWIVDPSVIDSRVDESVGAYRKAIRDLRVRAGTGPATVEATADDSELLISSSQQSIAFSIFSGMAAGFDASDFVLWLGEGNLGVIPSDAIPPAFPPATSFARPVLNFAIYQGAAVATAISDDFTLTTPEPGSSLAGVVAALGIAVLARRGARRRARDPA